MSNGLDILIPTYNREEALAITLTSLASQSEHNFRIVISDQSEDSYVAESSIVKPVLRVLHAHQNGVEIFKHLPPRGMAEQRQFLLSKVIAPYALFLDDDLILEPYLIAVMMQAICDEDCGFVGSAVIGLSFIEDQRPHEQAIEFWEGPVHPEDVRPGTNEWERYKLHNAANLYHLQQRLGLDPLHPRRYHVAWVGGCVLYDTEKLRSVGGFEFWEELPTQHCGEDALAQLRVMANFGGCGLIPSGVYHQELPTTLPDRRINAPQVLDV